MNSTEDKIHLRGHIRFVYKKIGKAIYDYQMIKDNDRILVGVSGGVDSTVMLKMLMLRKKYLPIKYDLHACYVKMDFHTADTQKLVGYLESEGIPVTVKEADLGGPENRNCFWCSWNRRKVLFLTAKELGCNKIALGHHLEDVVETILMNMCSHAELSAMKPSVSFFKGEFSVIRPLCYLEKSALIRFAELMNLPDFDHQCPVSATTARMKIKNVFETLETIYPGAKQNFFKSLKNIKEEYLL